MSAPLKLVEPDESADPIAAAAAQVREGLARLEVEHAAIRERVRERVRVGFFERNDSAVAAEREEYIWYATQILESRVQNELQAEWASGNQCVYTERYSNSDDQRKCTTQATTWVGGLKLCAECAAKVVQNVTRDIINSWRDQGMVLHQIATHEDVPLPGCDDDELIDERRVIDRPTFIYFARHRSGGDLIKIGISVDVKARMKALHAEALATVEGTLQTERDLHARFAYACVFGEWFRPDAELLAFIDTLTEA